MIEFEDIQDFFDSIDFHHMSWATAWWHALSFWWLLFAIYVLQANKGSQVVVFLSFMLMTGVVAFFSANLLDEPPIYYSLTLLAFSLALLAIVYFNKVSKKPLGPIIFQLLILVQLGVVIEDCCKFLDRPYTMKPEGEIINVDLHYAKKYPGDLAVNGKYKMHITCYGTGKHLVILDTGIPFSSASMSDVALRISEKYSNTTACAYDRLGYGFSSPTSNERTTVNMVNELRALLSHRKLSGKRMVYIGWSFGGLIAQLYARLFTAEMLGLVLVDSMDHHVLTDDPELFDAIENGKFMFTLSKVLTPIGFMRLAGFLGVLPPECGFPPSNTLLSKENEATMRAQFFSQRTFLDTAFDELNGLVKALNQSHELLGLKERQPANVPTVILRSTVDANPVYNKSHKRLLRTSTQKVEKTTTKSDHYIPLRDPDSIVDALQALFTLRKANKN